MPLAIWRLLSLLRPTLPPGLRASSRVTPRRDTTPGPGRKYTLIAMCHHGLIGVCHACYDRPSFRRHGHRRHWRWKNKNNTPRVSISGQRLQASLRENPCPALTISVCVGPLLHHQTWLCSQAPCGGASTSEGGSASIVSPHIRLSPVLPEAWARRMALYLSGSIVIVSVPPDGHPSGRLDAQRWRSKERSRLEVLLWRVPACRWPGRDDTQRRGEGPSGELRGSHLFEARQRKRASKETTAERLERREESQCGQGKTRHMSPHPDPAPPPTPAPGSSAFA